MYLNYGRHEVNDDDVDAVVAVLRSSALTQGNCVPLFEIAVCDIVGAKHGLAMNSATAALHAACLALGLRPGDIVWTVPNTFVASANCALMCGADVDFVDIDDHTFNMCLDQLEDKLISAAKTNRLPKIVIPVDFAGLPADLKRISDLRERYGFKVIEDASHSIGSSIFSMKTGSCEWSDITVFSFHPVKIIAAGEGGMALTNCPSIAKSLRLLRSHGITKEFNDYEVKLSRDWYYEQVLLGYNYRMSDIHASLGLSQLSRLSKNVSERNRLAEIYTDKLSSLPLKFQQIPEGFRSSYHLYVVAPNDTLQISDAEKIFDRFRDAQIQAARHYYPVHLQPFFRRLGFREGYCPVAERHGNTSITLPLFPTLNHNEQEKVVDVLYRYFGK